MNWIPIYEMASYVHRELEAPKDGPQQGGMRFTMSRRT